jgi:hypothetical protein
MSRFFRQAGDSDSESEESDEELMSSGDEDAVPSKPTGAKRVMSRFLKTAESGSSSSESDSDSDSNSSDGEDDDSDSEVKKVVKSAKDKRLDEMEATGKVMDNGLKINDWVAISNGMCVPHVFARDVDFSQNSTNWHGWYNDKTMSPNLYHHFTSARLSASKNH